MRSVKDSIIRFLNNYPLHFIIIHFAVLIIIYLIMYSLGVAGNIPSDTTLNQWDAGWYKSIVEQGYVYIPGKQCNLNFYPLFPYFWKLTGLSFFGISLVNLIFFIISMLLLYKEFILEKSEFFIFLSTPGLFFCFVPYSEALFFFGSTLLIIGLYKDKLWLSSSGILIACFTRSASLIFIPVLLVCLIFDLSNSGCNNKAVKNNTFLLFVSIAGTSLVNLIQYVQTGKFLALFEVAANWDRHLQMPDLPLTTWDGERLIWLDGLAFLVSFFAVIIGTIFIIKKFKDLEFRIDNSLLFSLGYLFAVTFYFLLYNPKDSSGGTSMMSLNRYVFATPYFFVFIIWIFRNIRINRQSIFCAILATVIVCGAFGLFKYFKGAVHLKHPDIDRMTHYVIISIFTLFYFLLINNKIRNYIWMVFYIICVFVQVYVFNWFLGSQWVG